MVPLDGSDFCRAKRDVGLDEETVSKQTSKTATLRVAQLRNGGDRGLGECELRQRNRSLTISFK